MSIELTKIIKKKQKINRVPCLITTSIFSFVALYSIVKPRIEIIIIIENNKESFIIVFLFKVNIFPVCYLNKSLLFYY